MPPSIRRGKGLNKSQRRQLEADVQSDEEEVEIGRRRKLENVGGVDELELPENFEDEEIASSDDGEDDGLPSQPRATKAKKGKPAKKKYKYEDDEISIGSSVDEADFQDLSTMLDDGSGDEPAPTGSGGRDRGGSKGAGSSSDDGFGDGEFDDDDDEEDDDEDAHGGGSGGAAMLRAAGLSAKRPKRLRERTETRDEADFAAGGGGGLSVDALVGSLQGAEGFGQMRRDLESLSRVGGGKRQAARAQLDAPLERVDERRLERQAATHAASLDVSQWEGAVKKHRNAEKMSFPLDRTARAAGASTGSLAAFKPSTELERGVEELLETHGLSESAVASTEELALADVKEDEVKARTAELRRMRDLLFHHERKLKRAAKIKSKSYKRVHKKQAAMRADQEAQLGALDRKTAQRLQLRKEMERVRERMTLKHKNTSRWAKHALTQQAKNPSVRAAIAEQVARGEELRQKQLAAGGVVGSDESSDDSSEEDEDSEEEGEEEDQEDREGGGLARRRGLRSSPRGLLSSLRGEEDPAHPEKGVLSMGFMKKAVDRRRSEAAAVLQELEAQLAEEEGSADEGARSGGAAARTASSRGRGGSGAGDDESDGDCDDESCAGSEDEEVIERTARLDARAAKAAAAAASNRRDSMHEASGGGRRTVGAADAGGNRGEAPRRSSRRRGEAGGAAGGGAEEGVCVDMADESLLRGTLGASEVGGAITIGGRGGAKPSKAAKASAKAAAGKSATAGFESGWLDEAAGKEAAATAREELPADFGASAPSLPPMARGLGAPLVSEPAAESRGRGRKGVKRVTWEQAGGEAEAAEPPPVSKRAARRAAAAASAAARSVAEAERGAAAAEEEVEQLHEGGGLEAGLDGADDELVRGSSLLQPSAAQQDLLNEAFPESSRFEEEKAALVEEESGVEKAEKELPGWGSWGGMGAVPSRRAEERKKTAAEERAALLAAAAARRKDAALRNVIISEKRDKKAEIYKTVGVPFPFKSREQFEASLAQPLGKEWNTTASHAKLTAPKVKTVRGAAIAPIGIHHKSTGQTAWGRVHNNKKAK